MSAELTRGEVERIAALAQIELDAGEVELFTTQLADILTYARQIQQIDTTGVPPTASVVEAETAERLDTATASLDREAVLANAPDAALPAGLFKVPRVIG